MFRLVPRRIALVVAAMAFCAMGTPAHAVPSFGIQTNQPCSACHVGAFGPRLKQAGRDFKLYGYTGTDNKEHGLPFVAFVSGSFTLTKGEQADLVADGYNAKSNLTFDELSVFYGGRILKKVGAFAEVVYDAIESKLHWEDLDVRYADDRTVDSHDLVYGVTLNNSPTVQDMWEVSPAWSFPFASGFTPTPASSPVIDTLGGAVLGLGAYTMWDDTLYLDVAAYHGLDDGTLDALGASRVGDINTLAEPAFYARAVWQHESEDGQHYFAVGSYGAVVSLYPDGNRTSGSDKYSDLAFDATYQYVPNPESSVSDMLSAHLFYLHETASLDASKALFGARGSDSLSTFRADVTYSFDATWTPSLQYFRMTGSTDPVHWSTPNGSPDSAGWIAELDYVPWGKPDSPVAWANARVGLQFTLYTKFDGTTAKASNGNTLLLNVTLGASANR